MGKIVVDKTIEQLEEEAFHNKYDITYDTEDEITKSEIFFGGKTRLKKYLKYLESEGFRNIKAESLLEKHRREGRPMAQHLIAQEYCRKLFRQQMRNKK